jgi:hypothetical protein
MLQACSSKARVICALLHMSGLVGLSRKASESYAVLV